jgi:hypothetical protein
MADFADFALKVGPVLSPNEDVAALLERLASHQVAFTIEDDPLPDLIEMWLVKDQPLVNIQREVPLTTLGEELEELAGARIPWDRGNARSFGQYIRPRKGTLSQLFGMTERTGHGGVALVTFAHRRRKGPTGNGDLGDLGLRESHRSDSHQSIDPMDGTERPE